ncbi:MAG: hypothetical protein Q8880_03895, partial [Bacteroidota bacterium]|nr:hypothetical protein [Bacteroidota bacterium]
MLEIIQQCYIGVFSLILVLLLNSNLYAQQDPIMTNNGLIYMNTGSIITVNKGSLKITDTLINNGTLNIINDFILDSNQIALVKGNGIYSIGGNWENNSNFVADNSEVILNGSTDQYIKGKKVTTFHNLRLEQWRY